MQSVFAHLCAERAMIVKNTGIRSMIVIVMQSVLNLIFGIHPLCDLLLPEEPILSREKTDKKQENAAQHW